MKHIVIFSGKFSIEFKDDYVVKFRLYMTKMNGGLATIENFDFINVDRCQLINLLTTVNNRIDKINSYYGTDFEYIY